MYRTTAYWARKLKLYYSFKVVLIEGLFSGIPQIVRHHYYIFNIHMESMSFFIDYLSLYVQ